MAHFAKVNADGIVEQVIVVMDCMTGGCIGAADPDYQLDPDQHAKCGTKEFPATEAIGQAFIASIGLDGTWKQTSYNNNFRGNFAGQGMKFDSALDAFITDQPFPSWTLNKTTFQWEAPTARPTDGKLYSWDESTLTWKANS